jgi:3-deoxy-manno-octulosonate cytidylyltransferase (CMP-KDO synthetase)
MRRVVAIIPARYNSTRLPAKPLAYIGNKTMIQRVYERVNLCSIFSDVIVATDDKRIIDHCEVNKMTVMLTRELHLNGTTRCLEVAQKLFLNPNDIVVNIQGDEPFIDSLQLELVVSCFEDSTTEIATLCKKLTEEIANSNIVKVVKTIHNKAIYFSRNPIPFQRDLEENAPTYFKHIGLYAYTFKALQEITELPESSLEKSEKLEQLRWIENGKSVAIKETTIESMSVDTPEDLERANDYLNKLSNS